MCAWEERLLLFTEKSSPDLLETGAKLLAAFDDGISDLFAALDYLENRGFQRRDLVEAAVNKGCTDAAQFFDESIAGFIYEDADLHAFRLEGVEVLEVHQTFGQFLASDQLEAQCRRAELGQRLPTLTIEESVFAVDEDEGRGFRFEKLLDVIGLFAFTDMDDCETTQCFDALLDGKRKLGFLTENQHFESSCEDGVTFFTHMFFGYIGEMPILLTK